MPERKYDFVFLDAGYTLFTANPSPSKFYHQVCVHHGVGVTREQMIAAMREVWIEQVIPEMSDPNADFSCSDQEDRRWWWNYDREVFKRLSIPKEKHQEIFEEIYKFFGDPSAWELYPDTLKSLEKLKSNDFSLAIVSNWNSSLEKIVNGLDIAGYFDFALASAEAGWKKPSPKIFQLALEHAGAEPSRVVHIGDTYQTDVLGARKAGIRAIMLDRRGGAHHDHEVITCLLELYPLLVHD
ncbi:MAG: HAD-IA family hydrolase [Candidatus Hydrogenedentota bacterium]|nr:MAG: HAD-IA family hydrolase [Candidatus Hydrogenedentota bacterium]